MPRFLILLSVLVAAQMAAFVLAWIAGPVFIGLLVAISSLLISVFMFSVGYAAVCGAPYVGSRDDRVLIMMSLAELKPGTRLFDLGSGDGRILIAAARAGAQSEGWEISPYLWLLSIWNVWRAGVADRVRVHLGDYWSVNFGQADIVSLYLLPSKMANMERKLRSEMKDGSRVVSNAFRFPSWPLVDSRGSVYLYRK